MDTIKLTEDKNIYKHTLSLKSDPYLDAHRLQGIPFFPFVMGLEYLLKACPDIADTTGILYLDYSVNNPIFLRRDRDKPIFIKTQRLKDQYGHFVEIMSDEEQNYISGKVISRSQIRSTERDPLNFDFNEKNTIKKFTNDLYENILPHGPHFHNNFDVITFKKDSVEARQHSYNNDLDYLKNQKLKDLALNPALLDGCLQLAALNAIKFDHCYILPLSFNSCFINMDIMSKSEECLISIKRNKIANYDIKVYSKSGKLFVFMNNLTFSVLKKNTPLI
ncbi:MAG: polyketide synthase dehydratase domain-containing protein [Bacteriovoracaceae bacterium]|nr:polyketide synthase dehydratase domain-containing protein [Bacteriovoracaceae bacterium]